MCLNFNKKHKNVFTSMVKVMVRVSVEVRVRFSGVI